MVAGKVTLDASVWDLQTDSRGNTLGKCKICRQVNFQSTRICLDHEKTSKHTSNLAYHNSAHRQQWVQSRVSHQRPSNSTPGATTGRSTSVRGRISTSVSNFLANFRRRSSPVNEPAHSPAPVHNNAAAEGITLTENISEPIDDLYSGNDLSYEVQEADSVTGHVRPRGDDWVNFQVLSEHATLQDTPENRAIQAMKRRLETYNWEEADPHDNAHDKRVSASPNNDTSHILQALDALSTPLTDEPPKKRARMTELVSDSNPWYPWPDRVSCTIDLFTHLPRSAFSQNQQDLLNWILTANGVDAVPSLAQTKNLNEHLQNAYGIRSVHYDGALGHVYYVNDLCQIIMQEMSNPRVRPHLKFYPEDTNSISLAEAYQADRWLHEVPDELLTPMARLSAGDFYIHEPAMLRNGEMCIPTRWYMKEGVLHAKCWPMVVVTTDSVVGWRVMKTQTLLDVHSRDFLKNYPELKRDYSRHYGGPDITNLYEFYDEAKHEPISWEYTTWSKGNPWRERAAGHRVYGLSLWLYCDDTSGNLSKKWNKHNSFLFTAAGLPREEAHKEYNVHFLSTSNIAPPLEMMDGVVDQLETAQRHGILSNSNPPSGGKCQYDLPKK